MATVVSIHRVAKHDGPTEALDAAPFIADRGLQGDWRGRAGRDRQITVIEAEALEHAAGVLGMESIPAGASRRQVMVRGIDLNATVGKRLRIGPLLVEVVELCDPCRNMERQIGRGAQAALENRGGICGRIIEGGILRPGDTVALID